MDHTSSKSLDQLDQHDSSDPFAHLADVPGAQKSALDNTYKITVPRERTRGSQVVQRYYLQSKGRALMPGDRLALCCRARVPGKKFVSVQKLRAARAASFGNVMRCERVWICPVCAARISEHRRAELTKAISENPQYVVLLATFTLSHHVGLRLADTLALLQRSYHRFMGGRQMQAFKEVHEVDGFCTALEVTHGQNGWHPHIHTLIFVRWGGDLDLMPQKERLNYLDKRTAALHLDFWERWKHIVVTLGGQCSPDAFDIRSSNNAVADYVAKFGKLPDEERPTSLKWRVEDEITKLSVKKGRNGGRTPFQLLSDYADGDLPAGELFKEFAAAFKGKKQLSWSNGMRAKLGLDEIEKSLDELLTEDEKRSDVLAELDEMQWRVVLQNDARGPLLEVASAGDLAALYDFLDSLPGMQNCSPHYIHAVRERLKNKNRV